MKCGWLYFFVLFHEAAAAPTLVTTTSHICPLHAFLSFAVGPRLGLNGDGVYPSGKGMIHTRGLHH